MERSLLERQLQSPSAKTTQYSGVAAISDPSNSVNSLLTKSKDDINDMSYQLHNEDRFNNNVITQSNGISCVANNQLDWSSIVTCDGGPLTWRRDLCLHFSPTSAESVSDILQTRDLGPSLSNFSAFRCRHIDRFRHARNASSILSLACEHTRWSLSSLWFRLTSL